MINSHRLTRHKVPGKTLQLEESKLPSEKFFFFLLIAHLQYPTMLQNRYLLLSFEKKRKTRESSIPVNRIIGVPNLSYFSLNGESSRVHVEALTTKYAIQNS